MEQQPAQAANTVRSPSVVSKDALPSASELFDFPITAIECQYHFRGLGQVANA